MSDRTLRLTTGQHAADLFRYAIGLDWALPDANNNAGNYPPHNIEKLTENHFVLTLAVAGFSRDEIDITLHKGWLRIKGAKEPSDNKHVIVIDTPLVDGPGTMKQMQEVESEYLYQGIAFRPFEREFRLGDNVEVKSASLKDGLLSISLERIVPLVERPKTIEIVSEAQRVASITEQADRLVGR